MGEERKGKREGEGERGCRKVGREGEGAEEGRGPARICQLHPQRGEEGWVEKGGGEMMLWQRRAEGGGEERRAGGEKMPEGGVGRPTEGRGGEGGGRGAHLCACPCRGL